jgi:hypothetical protein
MTQMTQMKTRTDFDVICVNLRDLRGETGGQGTSAPAAEVGELRGLEPAMNPDVLLCDLSVLNGSKRARGR